MKTQNNVYRVLLNSAREICIRDETSYDKRYPIEYSSINWVACGCSDISLDDAISMAYAAWEEHEIWDERSIVENYIHLDISHPTICFDFDGVIAQYDGWKGPYHIGPPILDTVKLIRDLQFAGYDIVILTARQMTKQIYLWLEKYGLKDLRISRVKPLASVYIDDRGYRFDGNHQKLREFLGLEKEITDG